MFNVQEYREKSAIAWSEKGEQGRERRERRERRTWLRV
jgi:hypothetical protein